MVLPAAPEGLPPQLPLPLPPQCAQPAVQKAQAGLETRACAKPVVVSPLTLPRFGDEIRSNGGDAAEGLFRRMLRADAAIVDDDKSYGSSGTKESIDTFGLATTECGGDTVRTASSDSMDGMYTRRSTGDSLPDGDWPRARDQDLTPNADLLLSTSADGSQEMAFCEAGVESSSLADEGTGESSALASHLSALFPKAMVHVFSPDAPPEVSAATSSREHFCDERELLVPKTQPSVLLASALEEELGRTSLAGLPFDLQHSAPNQMQDDYQEFLDYSKDAKGIQDRPTVGLPCDANESMTEGTARRLRLKQRGLDLLSKIPGKLHPLIAARDAPEISSRCMHHQEAAEQMPGSAIYEAQQLTDDIFPFSPMGYACAIPDAFPPYTAEPLHAQQMPVAAAWAPSPTTLPAAPTFETQTQLAPEHVVQWACCLALATSNGTAYPAAGFPTDDGAAVAAELLRAAAPESYED